MSSIKRYPSPHLPLSRATRAGDFLFLSGQIPRDADGNVVRGDIAAQTDAAIARISETLRQAGAGLNDVVRATVWLSDMALYEGFNNAYAAHFPRGFPARSCVQAKLTQGVDVEIEVQAWLGGKRSGPMSEA